MTNVYSPSQAGLIKLRCDIDLDDYRFDDAYFETLLDFMEADRSTFEMRQLHSDHFNLFYSFLQGREHQEKRPMIEAENKALGRIQDLAQKLSNELENLRRNGDAAFRLQQEVRIGLFVDMPDGKLNLADMLANEGPDPFIHFKNTLFGLRVAMELAKIEKPKAVHLPPPNPDREAWMREKSKMMVRLKAKSLMADRDQEQRYQELKASHGLASNYALEQFVAEFARFWATYSVLPFTEGKYEPDIRSYNSPVVDAAGHCLRAFKAPYTSSMIAFKIRATREAEGLSSDDPS